MGFPGQEYWSSCHFLLQGIFPTQESNLGLLHWQAVSLPLSHLGSPIFHFYLFAYYLPLSLSFPCGSAGKELACNVGDLGSIPGLGRSPGEGKGYPFQYSGLENPMDYTMHPWGWRHATPCIHGVAKSWTQLSDFHLSLFRNVSSLRELCFIHHFISVTWTGPGTVQISVDKGINVCCSKGIFHILIFTCKRKSNRRNTEIQWYFNTACDSTHEEHVGILEIWAITFKK